MHRILCILSCRISATMLDDSNWNQVCVSASIEKFESPSSLNCYLSGLSARSSKTPAPCFDEKGWNQLICLSIFPWDFFWLFRRILDRPIWTESYWKWNHQLAFNLKLSETVEVISVLNETCLYASFLHVHHCINMNLEAFLVDWTARKIFNLF